MCGHAMRICACAPSPMRICAPEHQGGSSAEILRPTRIEIASMAFRRFCALAFIFGERDKRPRISGSSRRGSSALVPRFVLWMQSPWMLSPVSALCLGWKIGISGSPSQNPLVYVAVGAEGGAGSGDGG